MKTKFIVAQMIPVQPDGAGDGQDEDNIEPIEIILGTKTGAVRDALSSLAEGLRADIITQDEEGPITIETAVMKGYADGFAAGVDAYSWEENRRKEDQNEFGSSAAVEQTVAIAVRSQSAAEHGFARLMGYACAARMHHDSRGAGFLVGLCPITREDARKIVALEKFLIEKEILGKGEECNYGVNGLPPSQAQLAVLRDTVQDESPQEPTSQQLRARADEWNNLTKPSAGDQPASPPSPGQLWDQFRQKGATFSDGTTPIKPGDIVIDDV